MAKAPRKPAVAKPVPAVPSEFNGAGDGAGGTSPVSTTGAGGDAGQEPITPAVGDGGPALEPTTPAASDAAGTDAPAESPAAPQGAAGGVVAPDATGGGANSPAAAAPAEDVDLILLSDVEHDNVRLKAGCRVTLPAAAARPLLGCGAAELAA